MANPSGNSVLLSGDARIDGLLQGSEWLLPLDRIITYSLNINNDEADNTNPTPDPEGGIWNAAWIAAAAAAFATWENVVNIDFQQLPVNNSEYFFQSSADLALTRTGDDLLAGSGGSIVALGIFPDRDFADALVGVNHELPPSIYPKPEGDMAFDNQYQGYQYLAAGGWGFHTFIHEIGHALGLKHPDDDGANARPTFADLGIGELDTPLWTIVNQNPADPAATGFAATPMPLDILAIQHIYGANMSFHTGDDSGINAYFLADDGIIKTIWDAGGIDTMDASGLGFGITLDLRPGSFTYHGAFSTTAIAYNVAIENAVGSAFNDTIIGNGGDNILQGGGGNDSFFGDRGFDTVNLAQPMAAYQLQYAGGALTLTSATDTTVLRQVETLHFSDDQEQTIASFYLESAKDANGDGHADIYWRHTDGRVSEWLMDGSTILQGDLVGAAPNEWKIQDTGDFNGDGRGDLLWRHTDGSVSEWLMDGLTLVQGAVVATVPVEWQIAGTGDFNGDGKSDIVWRNVTDGRVSVWLMDGLTLVQGEVVLTAPLEWQIVGSGDFNGDSNSDILWRNVTDGRVSVWLMDGVTVVQGKVVMAAPLDWLIEESGDFNGDGNSDILWRNAVDGRVSEWQMDGLALLRGKVVAHDAMPLEWDIASTGDFNGDLRADVLWRHDDGQVALWEMDGLNVIGDSLVGSVSNDWVIV